MNIDQVRQELILFIDTWYAEADFWIDQAVDIWYPYFGDRVGDYLRGSLWVSRTQSEQLMEIILIPWIKAYYGEGDLFSEVYLPEYPERMDGELGGADLVNAQFLALRKILGQSRGDRHFN